MIRSKHQDEMSNVMKHLPEICQGSIIKESLLGSSVTAPVMNGRVSRALIFIFLLNNFTILVALTRASRADFRL